MPIFDKIKQFGYLCIFQKDWVRDFRPPFFKSIFQIFCFVTTDFTKMAAESLKYDFSMNIEENRKATFVDWPFDEDDSSKCTSDKVVSLMQCNKRKSSSSRVL